MKHLLSAVWVIQLCQLFIPYSEAALRSHHQVRNENDEANAKNASTQASVTYFIFDGLRQSIFQEELAKGNLPEISKLIDNGTYIRNTMSAFPSMTGYGFYPLLTGEDAAFSGIGGLRWFDRTLTKGNLRNYVGGANVNMNEDIRRDLTLIFEDYPPDRQTKTALSYMNRGVKEDYTPGLQFATAKYREEIWLLNLISYIPIIGPCLVPALSQLEADVTDNMIQDLEQNNPAVHWITFSSPDTNNHVEGTTPKYNELVRNVDSQIGRYIAAAKAAGQHENRLYVVGTDHGTTDINNNINLVDFFQDKLGIPALRGCGTTILANLYQPLWYIKKEKVFVVVNGNTMNYLYFQGTHGWEESISYETLRAYPVAEHKTVDIVEELIKVPGIEFVITSRSPNEVVIFSPEGHAVIRNDNGNINAPTPMAADNKRDGQAQLLLSYHTESGNPLGYNSSLIGKSFTDQEWLDRTYQTDYPYAPVRLYRLLKNGISGEVVVTSKEGTDLAMDYELIVNNYRGGHGGIRFDQTRIPYILSGPGIQAGHIIETAALEDVGATLLEALQLPTNPNVTGKILRSALLS